MSSDKILLFLYSFVLGAGGAYFVARWGSFFKLVDVPSSRSSHIKTTPKGGGIGILMSFTLICFWQGLSTGIYVPIFVLSIVNLIGDGNDLSPWIRLGFQFLAALIVLITVNPEALYLGILEAFGLPAGVQLLLFAVLLIFVVGTANFYNFMDGIDGIAGIAAVIAFGFLGYIAHQNEDLKLTVISICTSMACIGFLFWNIPKAKVFMGDVGSILLGMVFAILVIQLSGNITDFICFAGFLLPFYVDELLTMVERIKEGEPLSKPHRRHLYQVLANEGRIDHWKISLGYGCFQTCVCLLLLYFHSQGAVPVLVAIFCTISCFVVFSLKIKSKLT